MPAKRSKPEQMGYLLRKTEVEIAGGKKGAQAALEAGRAEGATKAEAARALVAERRVMREAVAGASESCLGLRLRERRNPRWQAALLGDADRRIRAGVHGDPGGPQAGKPGSDRNAGGRDAGAGNPRAPQAVRSVSQMNKKPT